MFERLPEIGYGLFDLFIFMIKVGFFGGIFLLVFASGISLGLSILILPFVIIKDLIAKKKPGL